MPQNAMIPRYSRPRKLQITGTRHIRSPFSPGLVASEDAAAQKLKLHGVGSTKYNIASLRQHSQTNTWSTKNRSLAQSPDVATSPSIVDT